MKSPASDASSLCLQCGLCCNGVLFKDVELQTGDRPAVLEAAGLALERLSTRTRFAQPCTALGADLRCRLYAQRPQRCRQFECRVLQQFKAGSLSADGAARLIRQALRRADRVRRLLRELGDTREDLPLSVRFRRFQSRVERVGLEETAADTFADLTLAVQDLNFLLSQSFLPHPGANTL